MDKTKSSFILATSFFLYSNLQATNLDEMFTSGKLSGDVSITYESRKQDEEISKYFSNTKYSVGSIALNYETATYNNFNINIGFRKFFEIYEEDHNFITKHGVGDSTERIYDEKGWTILSTAYLNYANENIGIKVGRQDLKTDWLTKSHDAVTIISNISSKSKLNLIWSKKRGRVTNRELRPFLKINDNDGIYKASLDYNFGLLDTTTYILHAPTSHDIYGGKIKINKEFSDIKTGALIHLAKISEKKQEDGDMIELKAYLDINGYKSTLGYVKTGKKNGWASAADYGDLVVPFEEGINMYKADAQTIYFMLSKKVYNSYITGLYGLTEYGDYKGDEFNLWLSHKLNKNTSFKLGYTLTNEDENDSASTDMRQLNMTLSYKF